MDNRYLDNRLAVDLDNLPFVRRLTCFEHDFGDVQAIFNGDGRLLFRADGADETREAIVSESTLHPNSAWVEKQAEAFIERTAHREEKPSIVMHDLDSKFTSDFVQKLKDNGIRTNALPKASPNLNGRCERFVQTIKLECLAKFILFGKKHLDYLLAEFTSYYNEHRSHMEREHLPPLGKTPAEVLSLKSNQVVVKTHIGGLVRSFERKAA